ncbi:sugar transferase [Mycolicibacterium diernhoferi]|uniref:Polyprenyl glycosylphosphotransferase n=2 Tax=Mycolicibacterium diernhoferi TaxID=1801 RepID=A0A1Q4HBY7_9MYCO|nr:polyprenyl glycosylphosphotransferase [Mycolicibacterium diernhoferi]OPE55373.1 polyprenyl glycosylphosphotransferase [Mycolicibacterium diernhoferi]PEG52254.1 sugar transferase [Mycolicibacterium diernhoferi]QYL25396.1 sugar transferase [Mycolicibacterium diernhoferi]
MVVPVVDFVMMMVPLAWRPWQPLTVLTMAVLGTLLLSGGTRYVAPLHLSVLDELPAIVTRLLATVAAVAAVVLHLHAKPQVLVFLETACQAVALVVIGRVVTTRLCAWGRRRGIAKHHTVLIGGGPTAKELARVLTEHREYGLVPVGFVDDSTSCPAADLLPRLGRLADLDMALITSGADTILVADGDFDERALIDAVRTKVGMTAELLVVPRLHHFHTLTGTADHIGSIPIMRIRNPNLHGLARIGKRLFDIVSAGAALIVLSPVLAVAALAVRLEGGPGVIFRQNRVGRDGREFELLKFRSMRPANEAESQTQWNVASDNRVGPVGKFLRRTSIDELPQLWNIFRGDMTVVGPRPERPHFVEQFSSQFDRYAHRHRVQVGLTGFAQVSGLKGDTSIADRCRYDNFYIENWSLWLDIKIIIRTFRAVVLYRER